MDGQLQRLRIYPGTFFRFYPITAVTRINNLAQRYDGGCEFPEVIITNYDPREQERTEPRQLHLFSLYDEDEDDRYAIAEPTGSESEAI